jgi:hypothetical protein
MARFITLAGRKQVGKDTSAGMIQKLLADVLPNIIEGSDEHLMVYSPHDYIHIVHFADALKKACNIIFGIPLGDMETEEGKQKLTHVKWPADHNGEYEGIGGPHDYPIWVAYDDPLFHESHLKYPGSYHSKFMTVRDILQFVGTDLFRIQLDPDTWVQSVYRKKWQDDDIVIVADCRFPNEAKFAKEHGILIGIKRNTGLRGDSHPSETALNDYDDYDYVVDNNSDFYDLSERLSLILYDTGFIVPS